MAWFHWSEGDVIVMRPRAEIIAKPATRKPWWKFWLALARTVFDLTSDERPQNACNHL